MHTNIIVSEIDRGQALATVEGTEEKIYLPRNGKCEVKLISGKPAFGEETKSYTVGVGTVLEAEIEPPKTQSGYRVAVRWAPKVLWEEVAATATKTGNKKQDSQRTPKNPNQRGSRKRVVAMA